MMGPHIADRAVAYWTRELTERERADADEHLRACAACRRELDAVRIALDAVSTWPEEPALSPSVTRRILERAHAAPRQSPSAAGRLRPWMHGRAAAAIAALACGAVGFALGRATTDSRSAGTAPAPSSPTATTAPVDSTLRPFLLLLEERSWPPPQPLARSGYGEWSRAIVAQARFVGAQKLTDEPGYRVESDGRAVRPEGSPRPPNVSGWFIVRARSYEEAIEWARRGPHLAYGSVLVREIETPSRAGR